MKLLIRRNQRTSVIGKPIFTIEVRAELSGEEQTHISKYKLGNTMLYQKSVLANRGSGLLGLLSRVFFRATNLSLSVKDLQHGKRIECKDIIEMLGIEAHIKEAAQTFGQVLRAAAQFGGEEVIPI